MNTLCSLSALVIGQCAWVVGVEAAPDMRRRLLDIGLIPGTLVTCVAKSPAGDPAAYIIRGAVIALRTVDAALVCMECRETAPSGVCGRPCCKGACIWD